MSKKVIVVGDEAGNIIVPWKEGKAGGYIRVQQTRMVVEATGFAKVKTVSALIQGESKEDLKGFGWIAGQEVEGKIVFREQLEPFNKKDPERDYKIAGDTGIVCRVDGKPIYRRSLYTTDNSAHDVLVQHDNKEEIRDAFEALKASKGENPKETSSSIADL